MSRRDGRMSDIMAIREGRIHDVAPGMFSDDFPEPVIANTIDIAARDTAEVLAPLPSFNCSAANMANDTARRFADRKAQGIRNYIEQSNIQAQMYSAADWFISFGIMPCVVEPDFVGQVPRATFISPIGCYPEVDRWGRLISFTRVIRKTVQELCALYPKEAAKICGRFLSPNSNAMLEVVFYHDKDQWSMLLPERHNLLLSYAPNPIDEPCITMAFRPGVTDIPRGQFDDVIWIQIAKNRFSMMAMEAAAQAVEAPIAVPPDVQEFSFGPHATLRTNNPGQIQRVRLDLPVGAFQEGQLLDQQLQVGSRFPQVRTGNLNASIITGQGVKALEGGFDSAVSAYQQVMVKCFKDTIRVMLKMDEALWGDVERDIRGMANGVPYSTKWKPERDVRGDYTVDVNYGFAMGMDPNRALVMLLQMRGDQLISRDFTRRQFPFDINVSQEEATIEVENLRSALLSSVAALAQSIPALAQNGQDPSNVLGQLGAVIQARLKGKTLEDAVSLAFPPPLPQSETSPEQGMVPELGMGGGQPALPPGPGGGAPMDLMTMLSGLNGGGAPTGGVSVKRQIPA